jgi:tetratricopeptide (TPR) repeat protein
MTQVADAVGQVVEIGGDVTRFRVTDRVIIQYCTRWVDGPPHDNEGLHSLGNTIQGALAEYLVVDQHALVKAPGYLSDEEAASLACAGLTAWYSLVEKGQLRAEQTVLVQGTGGVSIFGLQIASAFGARVLVTSSSVAQYFRGDLDAFRAKAETAVTLNPRCSYTLACLGRLFCYSGEWEHGIQLSRRAIELSRHHPGWYHLGIIVNEYRLRRYPEALAELHLSNNPDYCVIRFLTAITQAQLGNASAAQAELERTLQAWPDFTLKFSKAHLGKWFPNQPALVDHILEGAKLAGFRFQLEAESHDE